MKWRPSLNNLKQISHLLKKEGLSMLKMNKKLIAGFVIAALASQVSFAGDNHYLSRKSLSLASELQEIAKTNGEDLCAGDVLVAGSYVQSAGRALSSDSVQNARVSLVYAQNELKEISNHRSYCAGLASKVKPYLAEVIVIQSELEVEQAPDNTSD